MTYNDKIYTKLAEYDVQGIRDAFHKAIPLKTLVITCPDPRASGVAEAVAREFGQTAWPGETIRHENGRKVGSTTEVAVQITAGGRAADALRSITTLNYLIGLENIVVVHHTFCGLTAFTPDDLIHAQKQEYGVDIAHLHDRATMSIQDFDASLQHDVALIRQAPGTPQHLNIFGYVYDIDEEKLIKVVEDLGESSDIAQIRTITGRYLEAAQKGKSDIFANDVLPTMRIQGYLKGQFIDITAQEFFAFIDQTGPASGLKTKIESIEVIGTAASLRIDCEDWHGVHYTDFMNLLKIDGVWKVAGKVFEAHENR